MNLKKINWYQQAGDAKPLYFSYPVISCFKFKINGRLAPVKYSIALFFKNNFVHVYLVKKNLKKITSYYYDRQLKNKKFLSGLYKNWQKKYLPPLIKINNQILSTKLSKLSNQDILTLFNKFNKFYKDFWDESIFLDSFDCYGEEILQKAIKKESRKISSPDLETLLLPPNPSFIQQETFDLIKTKDLKKHQQKYFWIDNDYATIKPLSIDYFKKKKKTLNVIKEKNIEESFKTLEQRKNKIAKKYKLSPKFINTVNFLALLGNLRDTRKTYQQIAGQPLKLFAEQFSIRAGLPLETIENFYHWEINQIFSNPKQALLKEIENRSLGAFYDYQSNHLKYDVYIGKRADKMYQSLIDIIKNKNGLSGRPAYPGVVRGKVKIISGRKDFKKIKPGDILVAPNTRPEYVPIMRLAGAIISAEGGITCHSAIVSRELKKPCIVGVQSALSSLKDGQLVEVDAKKGIITKL